MSLSSKRHADIAVLGAGGLIGGGFRAVLAPGSYLAYGRQATSERVVDLAGEIPPRAFEGIRCVIHAAGITDEELKRDRRAAMLRTFDGCRQLFSAAAQAGVSELIYVSSAHVYGPLVGRVDETSPAQPRTDYAIAHLIAERIVIDVATSHGLRAAIIRPNAVYGQTYDPARFDRFGLVPFAFPRAALAGKIRVGSPGTFRNFVSTTRVARQAMEALQEASPGQVVVRNAVGPDWMSMGQYAKVCAEIAASLTGIAPEVELAHTEPAPFFEYASRFESPVQTGELADFIRTHMTSISQQSTRLAS